MPLKYRLNDLHIFLAPILRGVSMRRDRIFVNSHIGRNLRVLGVLCSKYGYYPFSVDNCSVYGYYPFSVEVVLKF
jgi:hypothetical protein